MTERGVDHFEPPMLLARPWLDGAFMELALPAPVKRVPGPGLVAVQTQAGTHKTWRAYQGAKSPNTKRAFTFTFTVTADAQLDYERLVMCADRGEPVQWCDGHRVCDTRSNAVDGTTYTLTRPLAASVIPEGGEWLAANHPVTAYLNKVRSDASVTATGQTWTAQDSGLIAIWYTPVFWVKVTIDDDIEQTNDLKCAVTLEEIIQGDFR